MNLGDGQLKRIVHFKLFVAVESLRQPIEQPPSEPLLLTILLRVSPILENCWSNDWN